MDRETRPGDFSDQAPAYARARPPYPPALVAALLARVGRTQHDAHAELPVVELGAGTGLFTEVLSAAGADVIAVEPNANMRAHASPDPSPAPSPTPNLTPPQDTRGRVDWRTGSFEDPGLPPASTDWVVAAQALHWADPPRALPALRALLRPQGYLSALWNIRDRDASPLLAETRARIDAIVPGFDEGYRARDWAALMTSTGHFGPPKRVAVDEVRHVVNMSRERYLDLWRSHHKLRLAMGPARVASFVAELEVWLTRECPEMVAVPYVCRAWTARALPPA